MSKRNVIDFIELIQGLWAQKWLVLSLTFLGGVLAGSYAFLSKPVYEARVGVLPPSLSDVGGF
ncbi:Wzz/FepE/Etk N-terminal domain-containing protein, partial [Pseudomonas aeruginosa]|uniref:Wzz/FepE/Etk N-terminal domain-containing protein n=1 Tax=Pseudomonas aeruginosa TaxID=287 RepID=UPI003CC6999D